MDTLSIGSLVIYTDKHFVDREVLVTAIWAAPNWRDTGQIPCINLVFVSGDDTRDDQYGRQVLEALLCNFFGSTVHSFPPIVIV